jgi:hypothetical protein
MGPIEGRWVCHRCYASNDAIAAACARCGLERGADPTTRAAGPPAAGSADPAATDQRAADHMPEGPQQPQWTPPPPRPARPMWMQLALRFWWIGLIAVFGVGGLIFNARRDDSGQISNSGNLQVGDLRAGDCFNLKDPDAEEVGEVEARPCTETHQYELFHAADMSNGDYPSDDAVTAFLQVECVPAFGSYVGTDYQASVLEVFYFTPTTGGWDDGDHGIECAVYDPNQAVLTSSLKSSLR